MLELGGYDLNMLPNDRNYHRSFVQLGIQRRDIYYNLVTSHPGAIIKWDLIFFLTAEVLTLNSAFAAATPVVFKDKDGTEYQVKILTFSHDGYFVPDLSEARITIETTTPVYDL